MRRFLVFATVFTMLSCTQEKTSENSSATALPETREEAAVEARLRKYYEDMSNRDWEKYRSHFWEGGTITTAWQQPGDSAVTVDVTTIDDFVKETPGGPDSKPIFEERMQSSKIRMQGNIAEAWVEYKARFGTADSLMQWTGTDVFTLLKSKGEWKIVSLVFESDR
jgi:hypothetical protein